MVLPSQTELELTCKSCENNPISRCVLTISNSLNDRKILNETLWIKFSLFSSASAKPFNEVNANISDLHKTKPASLHTPSK